MNEVEKSKVVERLVGEGVSENDAWVLADDMTDEEYYDEPKDWIIQTTQEFNVTYRISGEDCDNAADAWASLQAGNGDCMDQVPDGISATFEESSIEREAD